MRHLTPADYTVMPWKNGLGTTTQIAVYPANSGLAGNSFIWRVSIADVASDGPFSRFPGYDRHIMTISGAGMRLDAGANGMIDLSRPFIPRSFSGDWDVHGALLAGPVRDFNLMSRRADVTSALRVESFSMPLKLPVVAGTTIVYVLDGELLLSGHLVATGDSLIFDGPADEMSPLAGPVSVAIGTIAPRAMARHD